MNWLMTIRIAMKALLINKLRSFLTVLGVIIGVSAVIAMVAIGSGARAQVEAQFSAMGTNMLIIQSGSSQAGGVRGGFGSQPTLTWADVKAMRTEVPSVSAVAAQLRTNAQVSAQEQNWGTSITGTSPDFFEIRNWSFAEGQGFTQQDVDSGNKVAVLGQTVVDNLFGANDPIGQTILIKNIPFQVVGVLESKGQSSMGQDNDDTVVIPETAFQTKISGGMRQYVSGMVMASATSEADLPRAQRQITELLRDRHHVRSETEDDFSIRNLTEMANAMEQGTQTLSLLLASIAAVSLLVGGIGIMNIMLVSVTERTREIGLRMAIGAKPEQILAQFLVEAVCLSLTGGFVGLGLGVATATFLAHQFKWPMAVDPSVAAIAIIFSGLVGVGFGLYPARKASQLNPIDALRFE